MVGMLRPNLTHDYAPWRGVPREPISTTIGLSAFLFNTGVFASVGAAAAFGGTLITGAVLAGAQFALAKTIPKPDLNGLGTGVSGINSPAAHGSIRQAAAPQRRVYGRNQVGGAWFFYDDATAQYQYLGLALARGKISGVRAVLINNNRIEFSWVPFGEIVTPLALPEQDYAGYLQCCFRDGSDDQAKDPLLE
jgi:hypothetical protein